MAYTKYSLTPANNNATPPDGAPEGMLPSAVNDTMRDMMAQIRDCGDGIRGGTYTMTAPVITGGIITGITDLAVADGGTGASNAAGARTNFGATTIGSNIFTLANPSAITFPRFNADNSVSALSADNFRTAIGVGTGTGTVTSVGLSGGTTGLTATDSPVTTNGTIILGGTLAIANGGTGSTSTTYCNLASNVTGTLPIARGGTGSTSTAYCNLSSNVTGTLSTSRGGTGSTSTAYCNLTSNITGILPVLNGGTGSSTKNFVDLTTNQSLGGEKTITATGAADKTWAASFSSNTSFISPTSVQVGASGYGILYSSSPRLEILASGVSAYFQGTTAFQGNNSSTWATTSDINVKTNIRQINNSLNKIISLNPSHFEYKNEIGKTRSGFIAQEFETIFPGHVVETEADDRYKEFLPEGQTKLKGLDLNMIPYLVGAIKELKAIVDTQAAKIAALESAGA